MEVFRRNPAVEETSVSVSCQICDWSTISGESAGFMMTLHSHLKPLWFRVELEGFASVLEIVGRVTCRKELSDYFPVCISSKVERRLCHETP